MSYIQKSKILQKTTSGASLTFDAPGAGYYNMLTSIMAESDMDCTLTIQSPSGSTIWQATIPAGGGFTFEKGEAEALRGTENSAVVIAVSAGTYTISARGYVTP
jgi:hypothetical protein